MLEKIEGRRRKHQWMRWQDGTTDATDLNLVKLWEMVRDRGPGVLQSMGTQRVRHDWVTEQWQQVTFERAVITEIGGCVVRG